MPNTYSSNIKLATPALGDQGWRTAFLGDMNAIDGISAVGALAVTTSEIPSATLNVDVAPGSYVKQDGTIGTYAGIAGQPITASVTRVLYLELTAAGALVVAASYPARPHARLATVVSGTASITEVADNRHCFGVVGSWADGVNVTLG